MTSFVGCIIAPLIPYRVALCRAFPEYPGTCPLPSFLASLSQQQALDQAQRYPVIPLTAHRSPCPSPPPSTARRGSPLCSLLNTMAILTAPATASSGVDIEAWTVEQAAEALSATTISPAPIRVVRGTSVAIEIPLDERTVPASPEAQRDRDPRGAHTVYRRREPIRRDSQKRREALLKGKEGSRRRQRWENGPNLFRSLALSR